MRSLTLITHHCRACDHALTRSERLFCKGVCPHCSAYGEHWGEDSDVLDTYTRSETLREVRPWWAVWRGPRWARE